MRVLSLFDGISCGRVALERAGLPVEQYIAYEVDKYAVATSTKNYADIEHKGNVYDGDFEQYKGCDLLLGGSPCTFWSIAKSGRETTCDGEGFKLFMEYVRALKSTGARYFIYENNYSIHQNIKDEISRRLGVEPIMINSALVSAQSRKRCYWTNIPNIEQPADKGILLQDVLMDGAVTWQDKAFCLTATYNGAEIKNMLERHQRSVVAVPISEHNRATYADSVCTVYNKTVKLTVLAGVNKGAVRTYVIDLPNGDYIFRKLTPIECERLQTLPDNYTDGVSKQQRYRQLGNGWTVDVISHILKNVVDK